MPVLAASGYQPSTLNPQLPTSPGRRAWLRFRKNRAAVISAWYLVLAAAQSFSSGRLLLKFSGAGFRRTPRSGPAFRCAIRAARRAALVWHRRSRARCLFPRPVRRADLAACRRGRRGRQPRHRRAVGRHCRLRRRTRGQRADAYRGCALFAADHHFRHRAHYHARRNGQAIAFCRTIRRRWRGPCA